ncbi:MAG: hypothetical protein AAFW65_04165, partial [Pseudomonadota bacterium]
MVWLVSHMWIALAGAVFFGLLLGWSFRGLLLRRKAQTAIVERDIARTELEQAQIEIDGLYAGQRKRAGESVAGADEAISSLQTRLRAREAELNEVVAALSAAQAETERLAAEAVASVEEPAETAGEFEPVERLDAGINQEDATLVWRNRYLESRVRSLETSLTDVDAHAPLEPAVSEPVSEPVPAPAEAAPPVETDATDAKLRWQTEYLKQRLSVLEASAISAHAAAPVAAAVTEPAPEPVPVAEPEIAAEAEGAVDEELARLRWRNRYLEGRVAYFEGDAQVKEPEAITDSPPERGEDDPPVAEAPPMETVDVVPEPEVWQPDPVAEAESPEPAPEPADEIAEAIAEVVAVAEGRAVDGTDNAADSAVTPPVQLDQPHIGGGDDLTSIEGIGPKIEQVLKNDLGVFHFEQIA